METPEQVEAKRIKQRFEALKQSLSTYHATCEEIAEYMFPSRIGFVTKPYQGQKIHKKIYDGTALWALNELASMLHGMLTNSASRWFFVRTTDKKMMENREVLVWLDDLADDLLGLFADPRTNFNSQVHELYLDLVGFGQGTMYLQETPFDDPGIMYKTMHPAEVVFDENHLGQVDTVYRKVPMKARNIVKRFGGEGKLPVGFEELATKKPDELMEVLNEVKPRNERDPNVFNAQNMPFSSTWILMESRTKGVNASTIISESGYNYFPYLVPRWTKMAGEITGRGCGERALADTRMLQQQVKTVLKGAQKKVDPPLLVPDDGFILPVRTTPSGLNFYRYGMGSNEMIRALDTKGDIGLGLEMIEATRQQILRAFYQDKFKLQKENIEMTRYEAEERTQENLRAMSPMLGRIEVEFLNQLFETTIEIRAKQRKLPPVPQILLDQGANLKIHYAGPLARAQKTSEAMAIQQAMQFIMPMAEANPEVLMNFNGDEIARDTPILFGLPARYLNSTAKVKQMKDAMAQQRAEEQQKIDAEIAAKTAAQSSKGQPTR